MDQWSPENAQKLATESAQFKSKSNHAYFSVFTGIGAGGAFRVVLNFTLLCILLSRMLRCQELSHICEAIAAVSKARRRQSLLSA